MKELPHKGLDALCRGLGPVGMARFLQLFENGSGDYVQERHERQDYEALEAPLKALEIAETNLETGVAHESPCKLPSATPKKSGR